jgi:hypothetical protein
MLVNIIYFFEDINLLTQCWEGDWIKEIFTSNDKIIYKFNKFANNVLYTNPILIVNSKTLNNIKYFEQNKFMIYNTSDETLTLNTTFINHVNCLHVFRNYIKPKLNNEKLTYIPLGYKQGLFKSKSQNIVQSNTNRKYIWSFCGETKKSQRNIILKSIEIFKPNLIHSISHWNSNDSLHCDDYRILLENTFIVPCLIGNCSIDTFRLYEALECGCIPIVLKHNVNFDKTENYYEILFGKHIIPTINNFSELKNKIQQLLDEGLEHKRLEICNWYNSYKKELKYNINNIIYNKFNNN